MKKFEIGGRKVSLDQLAAIYWAGHFIRLKWMDDNKSTRAGYATEMITNEYADIRKRLKVLHENGNVCFVNFNDLDFNVNYRYFN